MINIILCGGSGTRLWPLSRSLMPKQFLPLFEGQSLFQKTLSRNSELCEEYCIISNQEQYFLALEQLENQVSKAHFLLEPIGRNTAPAVALACLALDPEQLVLVSPSDHLIKDERTYNEALERAKELADAGYLVTFGIAPTSPNTGYGYIKANKEDVLGFTEKPDLCTAKKYLKQGGYYWNSGIFCFKAGVFLDELEKYSPDIYTATVDAYAIRKGVSEHTSKIPLEAMRAIPSNSIDYAVMEKSNLVKVVPSDIGWSDLGEFEALAEEMESTENAISLDSSNNFILSDKLVATIGIDDLFVINTADALLIAKKGSGQKVSALVKKIKEAHIDLTKCHTLVHRPWGNYEVLLDQPGYKLKRIVVKPQGHLSLQRHQYRNEHWIVISGEATVTIDGKTQTLKTNESTYIKMRQTHRLENKISEPLVIIEAQVGSYTGEDDIERLEDIYDRE